MNYATIKWFDIADGPGVRVSLYVSGCRNHCKNCFNPETWDFNYGEPFTEETENAIIKALSPAHMKGLTLLGGDPFEPENQKVLAPFLKKVKRAYPEKPVWCYTGYDLEKDVLTGKKGEDALEMLKYIDVLVDGRFVEELKDLNLRFRGSANQRIILVQPTLKQDKIVLWDEEE